MGHYDDERDKRSQTTAGGIVTGIKSGMKFDRDKPRYDLLPPHAIDEMAKVLTFGAAKYSANSWQDVEDARSRYRAALLRHTFAIQRGEIIDPESGLTHASHAMCCAAFLTEFAVGAVSAK